MHISDANPITVTTLGEFTLCAGDVCISGETLRAQKIWNLLAYLILHRDRSVPQAELIDMLWPQADNSNPTSALKTLVYRLRSALAPLFPEGENPILALRGSYGWKDTVPCRVDAEVFESLCRSVAQSQLSEAEQVSRYRAAVALYQGPFLPRLSDELWVLPLSTHYHNLYLHAVKALTELLGRRNEWAEATMLCSRACQLAPLDEQLHVLIIRTLLRQGKNADALAHYENATDQLYRHLGVRPSEELRALYDEIMSTEQALETDLSVIQNDLKETAGRPGAFVCEYGFFREVYRLECRSLSRSSTPVHICLLTLSLPGGGVPPLQVLALHMDELLQVLKSNLRKGDVAAKYSGAQFVVLLPGADYDSAVRVMERVSNAFARRLQPTFLKLTYKVRALD